MTVFYNRPYTIAYYGIPLIIPSEDYRYISLDDTGNIRLHKSKPVMQQHYFSAEGDHICLLASEPTPRSMNFKILSSSSIII